MRSQPERLPLWWLTINQSPWIWGFQYEKSLWFITLNYPLSKFKMLHFCIVKVTNDKFQIKKFCDSPLRSLEFLRWNSQGMWERPAMHVYNFSKQQTSKEQNDASWGWRQMILYRQVIKSYYLFIPYMTCTLKVNAFKTLVLSFGWRKWFLKPNLSTSTDLQRKSVCVWIF